MGNIRNEGDRAVFLAAVCGQTYAQFDHADGSFVVPQGYSVVQSFQAKSMGGIREPFGFILESPQDIIIAWRGSSSVNNWLSNMNAAQIKFKYVKEDCLTHRGFTDIYSSARDEILAALGSLSPDKPLYVTGHSLGGALATLCALDTAVNSAHKSPRLYTYGSPRAGDPAFAKAFSQYVRSSFRYANLFDPATYVPPTIYKLPRQEKKYYYTHVQTLYSLSFQNGTVELNHALRSYFAVLSRDRPEYTKALCKENPGFCPVPELTV
ncbi:lipase family protein [Paenibacillus sp. MMS20-IR301]|uniref:lipase family protein n=1 Tax=Paenibacillus sp. MMS20-IR301 TaxID=2895946 RepID=UPI0028ECE227|nr:lipase family protein [Paenibacillus sp. MMS20-IR301]WNS44660.1 lipase family protein [Paenibacillus sp. MMS20-IR301]